MKRAPSPRPPSIPICSIEHGSGNVIDFPVIQHLVFAAVGGESWLHRFESLVRALRRRGPARFPAFRSRSGAWRFFRTGAGNRADCSRRARSINIKSYAKTTGSRGIHVYVPSCAVLRKSRFGAFAKALAKELEARHPEIITAEYRVAKRPRGRVLVDYNQNAWNRTLASVYSVRPKPRPRCPRQ